MSQISATSSHRRKLESLDYDLVITTRWLSQLVFFGEIIL